MHFDQHTRGVLTNPGAFWPGGVLTWARFDQVPPQPTTDNFVTFLHSFGWSTADGDKTLKCSLEPRRSRTINFWMPHSPNRCSGVCAVVYVSTYVSPPVPSNHWLSPNRKLTLFFQQPSCHSAINTSRYSTHYSLYHPHTSDNVSWNMSMWIFTQSNYDRAKTFGHVFHRRPPFFFLNLSLGFAMKLILFFKFKFQCLYYLIQTLDVECRITCSKGKHTQTEKS